MMIIKCENCGCKYKINNLEEGKCNFVLTKCPMCKTLEDCDEEKEVEDSSKGKYIGTRLPNTNQVNDIIKKNYRETTDRDIAEMIEKELGIEDLYSQHIMTRRKKLGYEKNVKKYSEKHIDWLIGNVSEYEFMEGLTDAFNEEFGMDVTKGAISAQLYSHQIDRPCSVSPENLGLDCKDQDKPSICNNRGRINKIITENNNHTDDELVGIVGKLTGTVLSTHAIKERRAGMGLKKEEKEDVHNNEVPELEEPKPREKFNKNSGSIQKHQKSKRKGMPKKIVDFIEENYMEKNDDSLRELIADKFSAFVPVDKIENYRESNGMARPEGWNEEDYDDCMEGGDFS